MYFVNERFHNKALTGIVVSVSCSCALNLLNICTFTLHIRQTLATFPVMQFPPQLVYLVNFVNLDFCKSAVHGVVSFSILMRL